MTSKDIVSTLNFVTRDNKFKVEKPYTLQYFPTDPLPSRNYEIHHVENIKIEDARPSIGSFSLDREGVEILKLESQMEYDDYFSEEKLKDMYGPQVRKALMDKLGATRVFFHECVIRRRSSKYSRDTEVIPDDSANKKGDIQHGQPIQFVHIDYSLDAIIGLVKDVAGGNAENLLKERFQALNVWKPLKGPLNDWPLAFCDKQTVAREDLVAIDEVYIEGTTEGYQVYHNKNQRWLYLSDQEVDEALLFKVADTSDEGGVPHASVFNPNAGPDEQRESIELRCFVFYGESAAPKKLDTSWTIGFW